MLRAVLLVSGLLWACSESAQSGAGEASGGHAGQLTAVQAGEAGSDASGEPRADNGGSLGQAGAPAADPGAVLGGSSNGGGAGESGTAGRQDAVAGDANGGSPGPGPDAERLCVLAAAAALGVTPLEQSSLIASQFRQALSGDCHYAGLNCSVDSSGQGAFANALYGYGYRLWGCDGASAADFELVHVGQHVTQPDAEALIDLYVTITMRKLLLSDSNAARLRDELLALMVPALAADAASVSICDSGAACPASAQASSSDAGSGGSSGGAEGGAPHAAGGE